MLSLIVSPLSAATAKTRNGFVYRFSSMEGGEVHHLKANIQAGDCQVSALSFFPETCTLAVGFAFGTFQLWCLSTPQAPVYVVCCSLADLLVTTTRSFSTIP